MTAYLLLNNVTAVQTAPTLARPAPQAALPGGGAGSPVGGPTNQSFHAVVTGSGSVSATIHLQVSNDGMNWIDYPTIGVMTVSSGGAPQQALAAGTTPYQYFSAYVSAISGTNASVSLTMSA